MTAKTRRKASSKARPLEAGRPLHFWVFQSAFCLAAITILSTPVLAQSTDLEFDPWQGIEKDGRIPKVDKPDDLTNP